MKALFTHAHVGSKYDSQYAVIYLIFKIQIFSAVNAVEYPRHQMWLVCLSSWLQSDMTCLKRNLDLFDFC